MKVLAFDIDGTLAESRQPASKAMIKKLCSLYKDYVLVFLTGGSIDLIIHQIGTPMFKEYQKNNIMFGEHIHAFSTSGAAYHKLKMFDIPSKVYQKELTTWDKVKIYSVINDMVETFFLFPKTSYEDMVDDRGTQINFSLTGRSAPLDVKNKYDPKMAQRKEMVEHFKYQLPLNLEMYIGGTTSIDFTQKGINKGNALKTWMKDNDYKYEDVLFFGDKLEAGGNDSSVLGVCKTIQVENPEHTLSLLSDTETFK